MKWNLRVTAIDAAIVMVCCAILLVTAFGIIERRATGAPLAEVRVLIDPGHGGADGGATAADGTAEKDINLAISLPLADMLTVMGYSVTMTRCTDTMVNTEGTTLRERKVSDMRHRLAMSEQADITVSIHQNKFPQTQYYGTQIFYSANHEQSYRLAQTVMASVVSLLQPNNTRPLKKGDSSVYLLHNATRPMILVECGFLSNQEELKKLKDAAYQRQLAFAVAMGLAAE